ncbi:endolysin [Microbacterium phage Pioneer3]|nr:endolysin [Microbacterium phage Pioneer3]
MPAYANGRYPLGLFVHRGGDLYLSPSLNARWNEAVRLALEKYGVRLYITGPSGRGWDGWNGYRPYDIQVKYKKEFGQWAASAGTSSHGGVYRGQEVFALDVANWGSLAPNNLTLAWSRFVAIMRLVGLTTDFVSPREQWHVGDFNNAWVVPRFGAISVNPSTTALPEQEDDDMRPLYVMDDVDGNGRPGWALLNPRTGKVTVMTAIDESWATVAQKQEIANSWGRVWGSAKHCYRLDMLNAIDAIQKTL